MCTWTDHFDLGPKAYDETKHALDITIRVTNVISLIKLRVALICNYRSSFTSCTTCLYVGQTFAAWVRGQKEIDVQTLMTIELDLQRNLEALGAYDMLKELKTLFSQQVEHVLLQTEYDNFVQNYNMHGMGKSVNDLHAMLKLHEQTLPKRDASTLHAIRAGKVQQKNKNKKLQLAARGNNQGKKKSKLAYAPKPKIPPPPKKEDTDKD
uniref:Zinc finger, CCHC-type n=1 Tax=Tanacetum cinerariifolium TaxID=118510 RepID=A0A6L2KDB5_TANCI|nr:zinc finger, CCHC-type [Tanacetum cinerariifolium]